MRSLGFCALVAVTSFVVPCTSVLAGQERSGKSMAAKTLGYSDDRRGARLTYSVTGSPPTTESLDDMVDEAKAEFRKLHPHETNYVAWTETRSDGSIVITVLPYIAGDSKGVASSGRPPPPDVAPPPPRSTPDSITRAGYQQFRNGYRRYTTYSRWPGPTDSSGNHQGPGPWAVTRDQVDYVGGSNEGGSCSPGNPDDCPNSFK